MVAPGIAVEEEMMRRRRLTTWSVRTCRVRLGDLAASGTAWDQPVMGSVRRTRGRVAGGNLTPRLSQNPA
jgi:hypothetical protein